MQLAAEITMMSSDTHAQTIAARMINTLLRALAPGEEVCVESELLKHFPFARVGEPATRHADLRIPTTAHGAL
jgi:hypothetical protein